jgi:predicted RNA polymerase sigma factor
VTATDTHAPSRQFSGSSSRSSSPLGADGPRYRRAEELAQSALVSALEQWPKSGIPDHPDVCSVESLELSDKVTRKLLKSRVKA